MSISTLYLLLNYTTYMFDCSCNTVIFNDDENN